MYTNTNYRATRVCIAALLAFFLILFSVPSVLAAPTDTDTTTEPPSADTFIDDPDGAYVELVVEVPDGFRGSVSVMLQNKETGEMYTITAFRVNFYSNSKLLPYGEYSVEEVYTSEDNMTYEAFIEEDGFNLNSNYTLHAKVLHNENGAAYVDGSSGVDKEPSNGTTGTTDTGTASQPNDTGALEPDDSIGTDQTPAPDKDSNADQQQNTPADDQPESKGSVVAYVLKVILGTAVFVTIVFGTVYIVRKKQGL